MENVPSLSMEVHSEPPLCVVSSLSVGRGPVVWRRKGKPSRGPPPPPPRPLLAFPYFVSCILSPSFPLPFSPIPVILPTLSPGLWDLFLPIVHDTYKFTPSHNF